MLGVRRIKNIYETLVIFGSVATLWLLFCCEVNAPALIALAEHAVGVFCSLKVEVEKHFNVN